MSEQLEGVTVSHIGSSGLWEQVVCAGYLKVIGSTVDWFIKASLGLMPV